MKLNVLCKQAQSMCQQKHDYNKTENIIVAQALQPSFLFAVAMGLK